MEQLEKGIIKIIYKLEMIFTLLFDSMEHLRIDVVYEVKVGGLIQCKWTYLFKRLRNTYILNNCPLPFLKYLIIHLQLLTCKYLFNLSKRLKTKYILRLWYTRLIFLKKFQDLPHIILSLSWKQESTAFQEMMMMLNYFWVKIC